MDINLLKNIIYGDIERLKDEVKLADKSEFLHVILANYNWNNGFEVPQIIIENKHCDLGTALMAFYLADGYRLLESKDQFLASPNNEWKNFLTILYNKIEKNDFKEKNISYTPKLSKIQLYKLKKNNPAASSVFFGISGVEIEVPVL